MAGRMTKTGVLQPAEPSRSLGSSSRPRTLRSSEVAAQFVLAEAGRQPTIPIGAGSGTLSAVAVRPSPTSQSGPIASPTCPEMPAVSVPGAESHAVTTVVSLPLYTPSEEPPETEGTDPGRVTDCGEVLVADAARDRSILLRLDGVCAGQVASLPEAVQIGRHPSTGLTINDPGVSRVHARIYRDYGAYWIEDLGSRNGTYVQGQRVDHAILTEGDWVRLGPRVSFRYALTSADEEEVLRKLYDSSTRDALTGAYNRQYFEERLQAEIAYALRHRTPLSMVILDIDHFKKVNDTHGHQAGDAVLRHLAGLVQARLRAEDVFARYGGEEFVVVLRGIDLVGAARVGERVRALLGSSLVYFQGAHIPVRISAGCASLACAEEKSGMQLVATADRRLYAAKRAGRNRVCASD